MFPPGKVSLPMKLTKRSIDHLLLPIAGKAIFWDDELRGFGIRVTAKGSKSFVLDYRFKSHQRRITIGPYGELTPSEARAEAIRLKAAIRSGTDPLAERE